MGAVWALTGGHHDTTALCARDTEFVRMSRGAFEVLAQQNPRATSNMLEGMACRISAASGARTKRWELPPVSFAGKPDERVTTLPLTACQEALHPL